MQLKYIKLKLAKARGGRGGGDPPPSKPLKKPGTYMYMYIRTCMALLLNCRSIKNLKKLQRLDVGNNEIESLVLLCIHCSCIYTCTCVNVCNRFSSPISVNSVSCLLQPNELGELEELAELWLDDNSILELPHVSQNHLK